MWVEVLGWTAAVFSSVMSLPQAFRIARTGAAAGVSLLMWQGGMASGLAWFGYGLLLGTQQITWPNALWAITSAWIVWRVAGMRGRSRLIDLGAPVVVAAAIWALYFPFGPIVFGLVVAVPTLAGLVMQVVSAARAVDFSGISPMMLTINALAVCLWLAFGIASDDGAIMGADSSILALTLVNIAVLSIRALRMRGTAVARVREGAPVEQ